MKNDHLSRLDIFGGLRQGLTFLEMNENPLENRMNRAANLAGYPGSNVYAVEPDASLARGSPPNV
jgi:hypothetical protein